MIRSKALFSPAILTFVLVAAIGLKAPAGAPRAEPVRALLITGGGWHEYDKQKDILAEELYMIEDVHEGVTPLARAYGVDTETHHLTVWTNKYGKSRIFGTTIGHHSETMAAAEYLNLVSSGLLWAIGKLQDNGEPAPGYGARANARYWEP